MTSRQNQKIVEAFNVGYRTDELGNVFGIRNGNTLSLMLNNRGYLVFTFKWSDKVPVHRFVAYSIYWDKALSEWVLVRHLDGNPSNNSYANIAIGSISDNQMDIPREKRVSRALNGVRKICKNNHEAILEYYYQTKST